MRERVWTVLVCCAVLGVISPAFAADMTGNLENAESSLDRTLESLKDSVIKLLEDNKEIVRGSEELRGKIKMLKVELASIEGECVKKAAQLKSLEEKKAKRPSASRSQEDQLARAQEELERVKQEKIQIQQDLDRQAGDEEAIRRKMETLKEEVADLKNGGPKVSEIRPEMRAFRSERDRLLQEIQGASVRLGKAKEEWHQISIAAVSQPSSQELNKKREATKQEIVALKREIASLKDAASRQDTALSPFMAQGSTSQFLSDLEADLAVQEASVKALQKDMASLRQKTVVLSKKAEQEGSVNSKDLESKYNEAKVRNMRLRSDLDRLRREMIRLDKKKSIVEKDLYRSGE
ncbi:MAG: hypothetical protein HQL21_01820 [Candidatus Omnitrophica bacterium]|nr:hypothetical protein [Candidatus Omnitrophota bacterium]